MQSPAGASTYRQSCLSECTILDMQAFRVSPAYPDAPIDLVDNVIDRPLLRSESSGDRPSPCDIAGISMQLTSSVHQHHFPILHLLNW